MTPNERYNMQKMFKAAGMSAADAYTATAAIEGDNATLMKKALSRYGTQEIHRHEEIMTGIRHDEAAELAQFRQMERQAAMGMNTPYDQVPTLSDDEALEIIRNNRQDGQQPTEQMRKEEFEALEKAVADAIDPFG